ncbi:MAG: hypothetical protein AAGA41_03305 [Pseudomonadota bacterium]
MSEMYSRERARTDLALAMIQREARTNTIKRCTGLSDDRIRKLCSRYFTERGGNRVRRRRGKSPQQTARFVRNANHQLQATTLMNLFVLHSLIRFEGASFRATWSNPDVAVGERFCAAFDSYQTVYARPLYSFEWAWALLVALARDEDLTPGDCDRCGSQYVRDRYDLDLHICPACEIRTERRRRPGARHYAGA